MRRVVKNCAANGSRCRRANRCAHSITAYPATAESQSAHGAPGTQPVLLTNSQTGKPYGGQTPCVERDDGPARRLANRVHCT